MSAGTLPFIHRRNRAQLTAVLLNPTATHYEVLGVSPGALGEDVLRIARRGAMAYLHPDRNLSPSRDLDEDRRIQDFAARVNVAHGVLSGEREKRAYDAQLRTTHEQCGECSGAGFKVKQRGFSAQDKLRCMECSGGGWLLKARKSR